MKTIFDANDILGELASYMTGERIESSFLSREELESLSKYFFFSTAPADEILWSEGENCSYIAYIVSGKVQIKKGTEFKGNQVVLGICGKGAFIGGLSVMDDSPRTVTATAIEDTRVIIITKENFEILTESNPYLGNKLMKAMLISLSRRLKNSFDRLIAVF